MFRFIEPSSDRKQNIVLNEPKQVAEFLIVNIDYQHMLYLEVEVAFSEIQGFAQKHEERLHHH
jgi:hypothetical protein